MRKQLSIIGFILAFIMIAASSVHAKDIRCTECGMMVRMDSKFTAKLAQGDATNYFCDIGDLFMYLKKNNVPDARIEVQDYSSGEWIDARKAFYVNAPKKFNTPMGWGVAAFKDKSVASQSGTVTDFENTAKALK
jgi:nitrous oxide reductase accessory protein NosL